MIVNIPMARTENIISAVDIELMSYNYATELLSTPQIINLREQVSNILGEEIWVKNYLFLAIKYKVQDYILSQKNSSDTHKRALSTPVKQPNYELFAGSVSRLLNKGNFINRVPFFDSDLFGLNQKYLPPTGCSYRVLVTISDGLDSRYANDLWPFKDATKILENCIFLEIGKPINYDFAKKSGLGYFSTRIGLLKTKETRRAFDSIKFGELNSDEEFFKRIIGTLIYSVSYWERFYKNFEISLTIEGEERQFSPFFKKLALKKTCSGGLIVGIQRSESYFPELSLGPEIARDVYYTWNDIYRLLHWTEDLPSRIVTAYDAHTKKKVSGIEPNGSFMPRVRSKVVIAFDNIYGNLGNPLTAESYERFVKFFVKLLGEVDDATVLMKLKSLRNFSHPVYESVDLKGLIEQGRFSVWQEPRTDILAFQDRGTLFVGIGISSAISQLGMRGLNAVNFDVLGLRDYHPLYNAPYEDVVFDSESDLLAKSCAILNGRISDLGYWPKPDRQKTDNHKSFASIIEQSLTGDHHSD